jgi:hypothetical protein
MILVADRTEARVAKNRRPKADRELLAEFLDKLRLGDLRDHPNADAITNRIAGFFALREARSGPRFVAAPSSTERIKKMSTTVVAMNSRFRSSAAWRAAPLVWVLRNDTDSVAESLFSVASSWPFMSNDERRQLREGVATASPSWAEWAGRFESMALALIVFRIAIRDDVEVSTLTALGLAGHTLSLSPTGGLARMIHPFPRPLYPLSDPDLRQIAVSVVSDPLRLRRLGWCCAPSATTCLLANRHGAGCGPLFIDESNAARRHACCAAHRQLKRRRHPLSRMTSAERGN